MIQRRVVQQTNFKRQREELEEKKKDQEEDFKRICIDEDAAGDATRKLLGR